MTGFTYRQLYTTWESTPHLIYSTEDFVVPRAGLDASEGEPGRRRPVVTEYASLAVPMIIL
jgi:hypothetical protein